MLRVVRPCRKWGASQPARRISRREVRRAKPWGGGGGGREAEKKWRVIKGTACRGGNGRSAMGREVACCCGFIQVEGSEIRAESGVEANSQRELRQALTVFLRRKLSVQQPAYLIHISDEESVSPANTI